MSDLKNKYLGKKVKITGNSHSGTPKQLIGHAGIVMGIPSALKQTVRVKIPEFPNPAQEFHNWYIHIDDVRIIDDEPENLVGKRVKIANINPSWRGEYGTIVSVSHGLHLITLDKYENPHRVDGNFTFVRSEFEPINDENSKIEEKKENMSYANIVERTFEEAESWLNNKCKESMQEVCNQDPIYKEAIQLTYKLRELNEQSIESGNLNVACTVKINPEQYITKETGEQRDKLSNKYIKLKGLLCRKKRYILEQLEAYSSRPMEQERILIAYTILGTDATIQSVSEKTVKSLLDLDENDKIF